jgi:hypothetical protein
VSSVSPPADGGAPPAVAIVDAGRRGACRLRDAC